MHRNVQQWKAYIKDTLTDTEREQAEAHLYECDDCLANWMAALSEVEQVLSVPTLSEQRAAELTDAIMEEIVELPNYRGAGPEAGHVASSSALMPSAQADGKADIARHATSGAERTSLHDADESESGLERRTPAPPASARRIGFGKSKRRHERWRTMAHYAVAVCVTFAIMSTGILKGVYAQPSSMHATGDSAASGMQDGKVSVVDRVMNRTVGLLDEWTERAARNSKNEMQGEK